MDGGFGNANAPAIPAGNSWIAYVMTLLNWHSATHFGTRPPRSAAANERHPC